jgi:hypothetical protein
MFPDSNTHRSHHVVWILHYPTFSFLFGWLKTQLERREYNGEDELYGALDEILIGILIEMVFVD